MTKLDDELIFLILSLVNEIPKGKVATYGQIAALANKPKNSRLVGKVLSMSKYFGSYPCHRVVNSNGKVALHFLDQKKLLENEGILFKNENQLDLKKYKWNIKSF